MPSLVLATSNLHKCHEIAAILGADWSVETLREHPQVVLPEETGETFEDNAILKAEGGSAALKGRLVLADDSGLEVDILNRAPGVRSARFAGDGATDAENRTRLKEMLRRKAGNPGQSFKGRFRCCLALARDGKVIHTTHGTVEGHLLMREKGEGGFGYDSLFVPLGHKDTFGVLSAEVKNTLSHRARAMEQMREWLAENPQ